jgi:hypothetical protein
VGVILQSHRLRCINPVSNGATLRPLMMMVQFTADRAEVAAKDLAGGAECPKQKHDFRVFSGEGT